MREKWKCLRALVTLLSIAGLLFRPAPPAARAATNLLINPGFEGGWYHWNSTPELAIPNGWDFWWADSGWPMLEPQDLEWGRPETVTWLYPPGYAETWFWRDGQYTLKVFGAWRPIWWRLSQTVTGLTPGANYKFTVPVYPELVASYDPKVYAGNANAGEHRLTAQSGGQTFATVWLDLNSVPPGQWTILSLTFTAQSSSATVEVEMRGRWGLVNNAFFVDQLSLEQVSDAAPTATASVSPTPTDTPAPTASPLPTSTSAPSTTTSSPTGAPPTGAPTSAPAAAPTNTSVPAVAQAPTAAPSSSTQASTTSYTVQRGDTLWRIARDHGVTMDAIAALNGITNYSLLFSGTTLRVPLSMGTAATTSTAASQSSTSTSSATTTTSQPVPASSSSTATATTYVVQPGDTLAIIGRKFGLSATVLASANGLNNINLIYVGQVLNVPDRSRYYTVRPGDTLAAIAARFGVSAEALANANRLRNPNVIYRGQVLVIP